MIQTVVDLDQHYNLLDVSLTPSLTITSSKEKKTEKVTFLYHVFIN